MVSFPSIPGDHARAGARRAAEVLKDFSTFGEAVDAWLATVEPEDEP